VETRLSYFGSRYYSSDLSIWLSVDPMVDKYPSFSPYTYCANNPVKLVDPEGESATNFRDQDGNLIIHVEDGSNAEFKLNGSNQAYSSFSFNGYSDQGGTNEINLSGVIAGAQYYVVNNFKYCNQAVNFIGKTYYSSLNEMDYFVSGLGVFCHNYGSFDIETSLKKRDLNSFAKSDINQAVNRAAEGNLVVGCASGHVLTLTTGNFIISDFSNGGTKEFQYKSGQVANVNGRATPNGMGPNKCNNFYDVKWAYATDFYIIGIQQINDTIIH